jgi:hypothetical protein
VSTLGSAMPANCSDMAAITINQNTKFLSAGTLDIEGEEVSYSGSNTAGTTLTGIQRCLDAASQGAPPQHIVGRPVTPVLDSGESANYQAEITSTGTVGAAVRTVKKTVQR